jgi:hypothetical protein
MVDNVNPTSQFHPYQPEKSKPNADAATTPSGSILNRVGIDSSKIDALTSRMRGVDLRGGAMKARTAARNNGGLVLGGLAALVIGAGLMRKRSMAR